MSESHSPAAGPKQLILICVSTLLGNLLRGELTALGNVEVVSVLQPEAHEDKHPSLILVEVDEANETAARALLETSTSASLVFIGPLRRAPSNQPSRAPSGDVPKLPRPSGGLGGRREVRELSADVSVAEIVRVCRECLDGPDRHPALPPPARSSSPFQMFLGAREGPFPSLPAPLFPTSAPPSSHPSQRPSSNAPPPGPNSEDAEHESLFQLDPTLRGLLEAAERRVANRVSPRFTSPPDPAQVAQEAGFILRPEVRAALEEQVGAYEPPRRAGRSSLTPNSSWVTRTGHGPGRRRTATSEVSEATRDGETSIPTSASDGRPSPLPAEASVSLQPSTDRPRATGGATPKASPGQNLPKRWTDDGEKTPVSSTPNEESLSSVSASREDSDEPPSSVANSKSNADTTPPRRPVARDAVRPPRMHEHQKDGTDDNRQTAPLPSEPSTSLGHRPERATSTVDVLHSPSQDPRGEDARPTRPPGLRTLPAGRSPEEPTPKPTDAPHVPSAPRSSGEAGASVSPSGRRASDVPPLRDGDAIQVVARAIRTRYTGAIAVEAEGSVRRIVMRDGDFVTAASGIGRESLLGFLASQGTVPVDVATKLSHRLPNFGRHAGAALIAAGHLTQEQMWPNLRAHAEHIIALVLQVREGLAGFEDQVPDRLAAEPAVFGGATGAEVLVELVRRTVPPELALTRLGGPRSTLSPGMAHGLLEECALTQNQKETLERIYHAPLGANLRTLPDSEFTSVLYALVQLRVLKCETPTYEDQARAASLALDEQAVRQLIAVRKSLVEEADYFQLLGVSPNATGYDIRRAYEDLKRTFEPATVVTAATADLGDDVELINSVLDEAFEILHDAVRRERYRTAILSSPSP